MVSVSNAAGSGWPASDVPRTALLQSRHVDGPQPDAREVEHPQHPRRIDRQIARVPAEQDVRVVERDHPGVRGVARARELTPLADGERTPVEVAGDLVEARPLLAGPLQ